MSTETNNPNISTIPESLITSMETTDNNSSGNNNTLEPSEHDDSISSSYIDGDWIKRQQQQQKQQQQPPTSPSPTSIFTENNPTTSREEIRAASSLVKNNKDTDAQHGSSLVVAFSVIRAAHLLATSLEHSAKIKSDAQQEIAQAYRDMAAAQREMIVAHERASVLNVASLERTAKVAADSQRETASSFQAIAVAVFAGCAFLTLGLFAFSPPLRGIAGASNTWATLATELIKTLTTLVEDLKLYLETVKSPLSDSSGTQQHPGLGGHHHHFVGSMS
jgi:hypothetical protein